MGKNKLTLSVDAGRIKTLKIKAIQYELNVSELVEVFALVENVIKNNLRI